MANHSSILTWEIPWTGEPGGLQSMGLQRVWHHLATKQQLKHSIDTNCYYCYDRDYDSVQFSSVTQSCLTLCDPMNHSMPGLPVHHQLPDSLKLTSFKSMMPSSHLILCRPLLLLPPIPPSIRVFSKESTLHMRWPKYWSCSFSIIPSKKSQGWSPS